MSSLPTNINSRILLQPNNRIFVYIYKKDNNYYCKINDRMATISFNDIIVHLDENIQFENKKSLGSLVNKFKSCNIIELNDFFSIQCQSNIGNYLYKQIFSNWLDRQKGEKISTEICIITEDEYIMQLPWILLADEGIFLTNIGWKIFQASYQPKKVVKFTSYPKILLIFPSPIDCPKTYSDDHYKEFKDLLKEISTDLVSNYYLKIINNFIDLKEIKNFNPQIIYYYGHGEYKENLSRLIFEEKNYHKSESISIVDFCKLIQKLSIRPYIIYLNCCSGDTAGWLGAGNQLNEIIPNVITNRTIAYIDSSRQIALSFFEDVIGNGIDPINAINKATLNLSQETIRCITPVCYATYDKWESKPFKNKKLLNCDPKLFINLNRKEQCAGLVYNTMEMVQNKNPHSLGFFWYGEKGEGVNIFHERFRKEIRKHLPNVGLLDKTVEWPSITENLCKSLNELYCNLFNVNDLNEIKTSIGEHLPYIPGKTRIILIDHIPFEIGKMKKLNSNMIENYLDWWSNELVYYFPREIYILLGMSFIVPSKLLNEFSDDLENILSLANSKHFRTVFLPRLNKLKANDLNEFFRIYDIPISQNKLNKLICYVLEKSGGKYEDTLNELYDYDKNWFKIIIKTKHKMRKW